MAGQCILFLRPFNLESVSWPCDHRSALNHFLQVPVSLYGLSWDMKAISLLP